MNGERPNIWKMNRQVGLAINRDHPACDSLAEEVKKVFKIDHCHLQYRNLDSGVGSGINGKGRHPNVSKILLDPITFDKGKANARGIYFRFDGRGIQELDVKIEVEREEIRWKREGEAFQMYFLWVSIVDQCGGNRANGQIDDEK